MELKYVVPNIKETFGTITFGSEKEEAKERGQNGKIISRTYNIFADGQRADDVEVTIPAEAGNKKLTFKVEDRIELVNPKIAAVGYKIDDQAYVRYTCYADDIRLVGSQHK